MGIFGRKKTVEDIVAPITRIVTELQEHSEAHVGVANQHEAVAAAAKQTAASAWSESSKAAATASKIAEMLP